LLKPQQIIDANLSLLPKEIRKPYSIKIIPNGMITEADAKGFRKYPPTEPTIRPRNKYANNLPRLKYIEAIKPLFALGCSAAI